MNPNFIGLVSLALNLLLGGGILGLWLKYRVQVRSEDRQDFGTIYEAIISQRNDALERIRLLEARVEVQEAEINGLRIARDLDPFPNWLVDLQGCYKYVNREFETVFLEPDKRTYRDVVGKCHADLWPADFVATLENLDASARKRPDGTARAVTSLDIPGIGRATVTVHKFPVRFKGIIVANAGYITAIDPENEA